MTKVFIGGSRRLTRLNAAIKQRLDRIMAKGFQVLVGDANGMDKAVQQYLKSRRYENVEVFCSNGICRNNLGQWPTHSVAAPKGARGFDFYAAKDRQMTKECSIGFMLWDGESRGTLANILRLLDNKKKVVVYVGPSRRFVTLRRKSDWEKLMRRSSPLPSGNSGRTEEASAVQPVRQKQVLLF